MGHVILTKPLSGWLAIRSQGLGMNNPSTKFKVSISTHYNLQGHEWRCKM